MGLLVSWAYPDEVADWAQVCSTCLSSSLDQQLSGHQVLMT